MVAARTHRVFRAVRSVIDGDHDRILVLAAMVLASPRVTARLGTLPSRYACIAGLSYVPARKLQQSTPRPSSFSYHAARASARRAAFWKSASMSLTPTENDGPRARGTARLALDEPARLRRSSEPPRHPVVDWRAADKNWMTRLVSEPRGHLQAPKIQLIDELGRGRELLDDAKISSSRRARGSGEHGSRGRGANKEWRRGKASASARQVLHSPG